MKNLWLRVFVCCFAAAFALSGCMPPDVDAIGPADGAYVPTLEPVVTVSPTVQSTATVAPTAAPTAEPTPSPSPTPEPEFTLRTIVQSGLRIPYAENCARQDEVNQALASYYSLWGEWISRVNEAGYVCQLTYTPVMKEENGIRICTLYAKLESVDGVYALPRIRIDPDAGEVSEQVIPVHEGFSDPAYVKMLIRMANCGWQIDPMQDPYEVVLREEMFAGLQSVYTRITGDMITAEGSELGDSATARAAVLDWITPAQARSFAAEALSGNETYGIQAQYYVSMLSELGATLQRQRLGNVSDPMTGQQACQAARTALEDWALAAGISHTDEWQAVSQSLEAPMSLASASEGPVNRLALAEIYVYLFEAAFGEIDEVQWSNLTDTTAVPARKAYGMYLMPAFPGSRYFSPDYVPGTQEIYEATSHFVSGFALRFMKEYRQLSEGSLTRLGLYQGLERMLSRFSHITPVEYTSFVQDNSRMHEWYVNQYDGTPYAASNCMPAITCMALSWLDPAYEGTPSDIRELSGSEEIAWRMRTVEKVLQLENVQYYVRRVSSQKMMEDLDEGRLLLVQIHEGNLANPGHCLVVYGYRRIADSVEFLVHDPGYSRQTDLYGEPLGKSLTVSASYLELIASRIASSYLAVHR